jgi:acyl carrier protein
LDTVPHNPLLNQIAHELCLFIKGNITDKKVELDFDTSFSSLGIDSLSIVEMVLFLERKYNMTLPEEELIPENFKSINTLAACAYRQYAS